MADKLVYPDRGFTSSAGTELSRQNTPCPSFRRHGRPARAERGRRPPKTKRRSGIMTLRELAAIMFIILVILAIAIPYRLRQTQSMRNAACIYAMKQIGLALQAYHNEYGRFPPPYTVDEEGNRLHSWRMLILPYFGRRDIFQGVRLDEPWDSEHNRQFASEWLSFYECPTGDFYEEYHEFPGASYVMITGPGTVGEGTEGARLGNITDAHDSTVLVAEVALSPVHWMEPRDYDFAAGPHRLISRPNESDDTVGLGSNHVDVVNMLMVDGSVKSVPVDINEKVFRALMTIAGGEEVELE